MRIHSEVIFWTYQKYPPAVRHLNCCLAANDCKKQQQKKRSSEYSFTTFQLNSFIHKVFIKIEEVSSMSPLATDTNRNKALAISSSPVLSYNKNKQIKTSA